MGFTLIFFLSLLSFGEVTISQQDSAASENSSPSSFLSCMFHKDSAERPKTLSQWRQKYGNTHDFYAQLSKEIEKVILENLRQSENLIQCLSPIEISKESSNCEDIRNYVNPYQYPGKRKGFLNDSQNNGGSINEPDNLADALEISRFHLIMANLSLRYFELKDAKKIDLKPFGVKSVSWSTVGQNEIRKYRRFFEKNFDEFVKKYKISKKEFDTAINTPVRSTALGQTPEEGRILSIQQTFFNFVRDKGINHLYWYRSIINRHRIINYISSPRASETEILSAANKIQANARKELKNIQNIGNRLNAMKPHRPPEALSLLNYHGIIDNFLMKNPHYCLTANQEMQNLSDIKLRRFLFVGAPVLATSFLASSGVGMALGAGSATFSAYSVFNEREGHKQSAFSVIEDKKGVNSPYRTEANLTTLDQEYEDLINGVAMVPLAGILGAGFSKAGHLSWHFFKTKASRFRSTQKD